MFTSEDLKCGYRGKTCKNGMYPCSIHRTCTLTKINAWTRSCDTCSDRDGNQPPVDNNGILVGSAIESALESVGVSKTRVSTWLGVPCNCEEHRDKINRLHQWLAASAKLGIERSKVVIESLLAGRKSKD